MLSCNACNKNTLFFEQRLVSALVDEALGTARRFSHVIKGTAAIGKHSARTEDSRSQTRSASSVQANSLVLAK